MAPAAQFRRRVISDKITEAAESFKKKKERKRNTPPLCLWLGGVYQKNNEKGIREVDKKSAAAAQRGDVDVFVDVRRSRPMEQGFARIEQVKRRAKSETFSKKIKRFSLLHGSTLEVRKSVDTTDESATPKKGDPYTKIVSRVLEWERTREDAQRQRQRKRQHFPVTWTHRDVRKRQSASETQSFKRHYMSNRKPRVCPTSPATKEDSGPHRRCQLAIRLSASTAAHRHNDPLFYFLLMFHFSLFSCAGGGRKHLAAEKQGGRQTNKKTRLEVTAPQVTKTTTHTNTHTCNC